MDQVKIGKYIAEKRKTLGYTQVQLAERIGMSDKSVSKWERGVCLPDVSVYESLCAELGISLNEFFAGEDIEEEKVIKKSEENLLKASWFIKKKNKSFKKLIVIFVILIIGLIGLFTKFLYSEGYFIKNYIEPYPETSGEHKMAELLSGEEGIYLYKYHVEDKYNVLNIKKRTYRNAKLVSEETEELPFGIVNEGEIVFVPDAENGKIRVLFTTGGGELSLESSFKCDKVSLKEYQKFNGFLVAKQKIDLKGQTPILVLIYDKDGCMTSHSFEGIEGNQSHAFRENDLTYYFTVTLDKVENE